MTSLHKQRSNKRKNTMNNAQRITLIKTLAKSNISEAVARCCWHNVELGQEGNRRVGFFIDNAAGMAYQAGITPHQFAGALGALQKAGEYQPSEDPEYTGHFGYMIRQD